MNYDLNYDFYWCTVVTIIWIGGYRIGQTIALMIALDRFFAIAMPTFYMKRQGNVRDLEFLNDILASQVLIFSFNKIYKIFAN